MKVKVLVGALVVLVIMNIAAIGSFWFMHHSHRGHRDRDQRSDRSAMRDLPREERRKLFRTMRSFREEVRPLNQQTDRLEEDLIASMRKDPVPRAHIDSVLQQISQNRLEIARRATDRMIAMGDSLSPAERELMLDALRRFHRGGFDGRSRRSQREEN